MKAEKKGTKNSITPELRSKETKQLMTQKSTFFQQNQIITVSKAHDPLGANKHKHLRLLQIL